MYQLLQTLLFQFLCCLEHNFQKMESYKNYFLQFLKNILLLFLNDYNILSLFLFYFQESKIRKGEL